MIHCINNYGIQSQLYTELELTANLYLTKNYKNFIMHRQQNYLQKIQLESMEKYP